LNRPKTYSKENDFYQTKNWYIVRYAVLKAAKGKCMCCGGGGMLHVDHIKPRAKYPKLELDPNNQACNLGKGKWDETDWRNTPLAQ
jgi:5-methylcytosine-specific restriction endonuclease McrA